MRNNRYTQQFTTATAFIETLGNDRAKIRLSFVAETKSSTGSGREGAESKPIEDANVYQKAFDAIQKAVFVRKNS